MNDYMKEEYAWELFLNVRDNEKRAEGREEGLAEGRVEGENKLAALFSKLFAAGRIKDAEKASVDEEYRSKLSAEFRMG